MKQDAAPSADEVAVLEPAALQAYMAEDSNLLLLQVTSAEVFQQAHIPGALLVTPAQLVCGVPPATGKLPELKDLQQLFSGLGYTPQRNIVVYDDEGGGWAGRLAWTLDVIGHRRWCYLNGGLHAWYAAGLPLAAGAAEPPAPTEPALSIDTAPIAELEDVLDAVSTQDQVIWDVRSQEEYLGQRQAAARSGHIPGAVNLDWMLLKDPSRQLRLTENIAMQLNAIGINGERAVITHCQTHHRSGLSYMLGRLLGLDIRAYHGSWSEWGNRQDTPIEV